MGHKGNRKRTGRQMLTAEQRMEFVKDRRAIIGKLLTQEGFEGALVIEHVRGSQYIVKLTNGQEVFASHKKHKTLPGGAVSVGGWQLWEER